MIKERELWNKLRKDICNIILNTDTNLIFLIGENSTGKSEIGEFLNDKIIVLDNYTGSYDSIPKNEKVLVITHNVHLLLQADKNTKVIITQMNGLYTLTNCDVSSYGDIVQRMNNTNPMSVFLNNAISGNWSELNEMFLQEYLKTHQISSADKLVLETIEEFKKS